MFHTICYFDMGDNCIGYIIPSTIAECIRPTNEIVGEGEYNLPLGLDPIGKSASQLLAFGVLTQRPLTTNAG